MMCIVCSAVTLPLHFLKTRLKLLSNWIMYVYTTHFAGFPFLVHQWQAFPDIKCSKCSKIADMKPVSFKIQLTRVSHSECAIMTLSHRSTGFLYCISSECHQSSTLCCIIYCKFLGTFNNLSHLSSTLYWQYHCIIYCKFAGTFNNLSRLSSAPYHLHYQGLSSCRIVSTLYVAVFAAIF